MSVIGIDFSGPHRPWIEIEAVRINTPAAGVGLQSRRGVSSVRSPPQGTSRGVRSRRADL